MAAGRSIFEEVSAPRKGPAPPAGGMIGATAGRGRRAIRLWLVTLFLLVAAMVIVGGLTRLADAGLSITEWRPVTGALPPFDAAGWEAEFARYRDTPQFARANPGMTLDEFRVIYWWEWGHRQLGRLIGLVWGLGFLWFLLRRRIPAGWTGRLLLVGALGGLQGAIGWWMVTSGLAGARIAVAPYRLAVHLGLAFVILGFIGWYVLCLGRSGAHLMTARRAGEHALARGAAALLALVMLQVLLGALVAGTGAGAAFPTWPLMGEHFLPPDPFYVTDLDGVRLAPWHAFFEGQAMTQFLHRMAGYLVLLGALALWMKGRKSVHRHTRLAFSLVLLMIVAQVALGILAVLTLAPLDIAITHQIGAILVWLLLLRALHLARYPISGSIREGTA